MKDFARLRIDLRFDARRLLGRKKAEYPLAIVGSAHNVSSAVMIPSRPKGVLNHGTPAYGYGPCGVRDTSILMSAAARRTQKLKRSLELSTSA